jgi:hypothetical protein
VSFSPEEQSPISMFGLSNLCEQIQDLWLSQWISQSTWGYPIIGAAHVLGMAFFGGALLVANFCSKEDAEQVRTWKWIGFSVVSLSGILLFASNAVRYYRSISFDAKMLLFLLFGINALCLPRNLRRGYISAILWIALIFASRGIAFF